MFAMRCSSFCSTMPCLFEFILMPKSSSQECYMLLSAVCYQNYLYCHFCCIFCVHPMSMSSTWVSNYIRPSLQWCNPCIFVSLVVGASSSWSRVFAVTVLLDWICYLMMLCKPAATSHSIHNLDMFTKDVLLHMSCSIHPCSWFIYSLL